MEEEDEEEEEEEEEEDENEKRESDVLQIAATSMRIVSFPEQVVVRRSDKLLFLVIQVLFSLPASDDF